MKQQLYTSISGFALKCAFFLTLLIGFNSWSQTYPVQANVSTSQPFLNYLSYYGDQNNHLQITLTSLDITAPTLLVRLRIRFEGIGWELYTNPNATIGQPFILDPGMPVTVSGIDLLPYLQQNNLVNPSGVNINNLPAGPINVWVDVIRESANKEVLSTDNWGVINIAQYAPPQPNPFECGQVLDTNAMFHQLNWSPVTPMLLGADVQVEYDVRIYHWLDPLNNTVFNASFPLIYPVITDDFPVNFVQISDFDGLLEVGETYVWTVTARVISNGNEIPIVQNGGVSAPCTFVYGEAPSLNDVLGDGLEIELFAQASSQKKGKAWWKVTDDTPNQGLSDFDQYYLEYRKQPTGNEGFEIPWFSATRTDTFDFIYQLDPSTTYEVKVSGIIGGVVGDPTDVVTFTTLEPRDYNCGEADLPFLPSTYTVLENALVGTQVQIGQFMMTMTEVNALGAAGHYSGKGEIPIAFLMGAKAKVRFDDILIDTEYRVHEGRVDVITEGLQSWLNDQMQQFIDPYYVEGTIDSAYVLDSVAWVVVDGVAQPFYFDPPNYPIIVNDASGNQYTIYPNGVIVVGTYLSVSETWQVAANETVRFGQNDTEERGFDPKEHQEWHENYETMKLSDNTFYYVANKSLAKNEGDMVNVQFPANVTHVRFELPNGDTIPYVDLEGSWMGAKPYLDSGLVKTLYLPSFSSGGKYEVSAFVDGVKSGQLNIQVYSEKTKEVVVVPIASIAGLNIDATEIENELKRTLGEANITVDVTLEDPWTDSTGTFTATTNISLPTEVGLLTKYSDNMRDLRDAYFEQHPNASKNKYYVFLVNGFDDPSQLGYMVRGRSMGFVKASSSSTQAEVLQTISHELGHGMGALEHTFKNEVIAQGSTNNLMDYSGETNLTIAQWKELRDLDLAPSLFDDTEDGSLTQVYDLVVIDAMNTNFGVSTGTTQMIYTPSGFTFEATIQDKPKFNHCIGGVEVFKASDTIYAAVYLGAVDYIGSFLGYFPSDVNDRIIAIQDSVRAILPNDMVASHIYRPLTWSVLKANEHRQFQAYNLNGTGQFYSEYIDANCTMHGTTFNVINPLTTDGNQTNGYPLSGKFMSIGERELTIVDEELPWTASDCSGCFVTSELYAVHDDYFPHDQSGFAAQNAPTFQYNVNVHSVTVGSPSTNVGEQLLNKFKNLINSNLRAGKVHNYMGTSQNYHVIGNDQGHLSAENREIIEHRLAYLYDYSKELNPSEPIEIYVVFGNTSINGQYFFIDDFNRFAKDVFNASDLKSKKAILITVPWGRYNSLNGNGQGMGVNYTNDKWAFMPGIYGNVLVNYDKLEPQYANQLYAANSNSTGAFALSEFILDVYTHTYKPVKIHFAFQELDGSISKKTYESEQYKAGFGFCKAVILKRKPEHAAFNEPMLATEQVGVLGGSPLVQNGPLDVLNYEMKQAQLLESAKNSGWETYTPSGEYAQLKEKYIDLFENVYVKYAYSSEFEQWAIDYYMATSGFTLTTPPPALNSNYYYTPSTWAVVSPMVYGTIDLVGFGLGFVGLDGVTDGIGLAVALAAGDGDHAASYGAAIAIVGVSGGVIKLAVEYGPSLVGKTRMFYKGFTFVLKNGEWTKINKSVAYGRVFSFFKLSDEGLISVSEMDAFITKLSNGDFTHTQIRSIIEEPTQIARANKFKQITGFNLLTSLQGKFAGKQHVLTWLNQVSNNTAILNKLDELPVSMIDNFNKDINTLKTAFVGSPDLIDSWKVLNEANSTLKINVSVLDKVNFLKNNGLTDIQLINIGRLNDIKAFDIAQSFASRTNALNDGIDELLTSIYTTVERPELAQWASQFGIEVNLVGQLDQISKSTAWQNPESILDFFKNYITKRFDNPGYIEQFNEAVRQLNNGKTIKFEINGDIVDISGLKTYQYKAISGSESNLLKNNLSSASGQFITEVPMANHSKIVKLKFLNAQNADFNASPQQIRSKLQAYYNQVKSLDQGANLRALFEIQIDNSHGLLRFNIINDVVFTLN